MDIQHQMPGMQVHSIDWKILGLLQGDARMSKSNSPRPSEDPKSWNALMTGDAD